MKRSSIILAALILMASTLAFAPAVEAGAARAENVAFVSAVNLQSEHIALDGRYLYSGFNNLTVVDYGQAARLRPLNRINTAFIYDLELSGQYVFTGQQDFGVRVFDVTVGVPTELGSRYLGGSVFGIDLADGVLYAANGRGGLVLIDGTRPADLPELSRTDTGGMALDVAAAGDYAYVANGKAGLLVYDIRDKSRPALVANLDTPGSASDVTISGNTLFLADGSAGLRILDISSPAAPVELAVYDTPGSVERTVIEGDYAYLADRQAGLVVLDIKDRTKPVKAGSYDSPGGAWDLAVKDGIIFLADYPYGLWVLRFTPPA